MNDQLPPITDPMAARDYLRAMRVELDLDPRDPIEIANLHRLTGSTAIQGTTEVPKASSPDLPLDL